MGLPKGVMISHDSILYCAHVFNKALKPGQETTVSYLPLNHIGGQFFDIILSIANGSCVYFADRDALTTTLVRTFVEARPTFVIGVPRVYEKIQENLMNSEENNWWILKSIRDLSRATMLQYHLDLKSG